MKSKFSILIVLILAAGFAGGCGPNASGAGSLYTTNVPVLEVEGLHFAPARAVNDQKINFSPLKPPPAPKPAIVTRILGKSRQGKSISMTVFGKTGPTLLVFAGIHGNEPRSVAVAKKLDAELRANRDLVQSCRVALISCVSPDGLALNSRYNATGTIDLNRNFPARSFTKRDPRCGPAPASEPETKCVLAAVSALSPKAIISIHTCDRRRPGSTRDRHGNNWDGKGKALADAMARHNRYRSFGEWHNKTPGSFGSYANDNGLCVVTLEIPNDVSASAAWTANRGALIEAIRYTRSSR